MHVQLGAHVFSAMTWTQLEWLVQVAGICMSFFGPSQVTSMAFAHDVISLRGKVLFSSMLL